MQELVPDERKRSVVAAKLPRIPLAHFRKPTPAPAGRSGIPWVSATSAAALLPFRAREVGAQLARRLRREGIRAALAKAWRTR